MPSQATHVFPKLRNVSNVLKRFWTFFKAHAQDSRPKHVQAKPNETPRSRFLTKTWAGQAKHFRRFGTQSQLPWSIFCPKNVARGCNQVKNVAQGRNQVKNIARGCNQAKTSPKVPHKLKNIARGRIQSKNVRFDKKLGRNLPK